MDVRLFRDPRQGHSIHHYQASLAFLFLNNRLAAHFSIESGDLDQYKYAGIYSEHYVWSIIYITISVARIAGTIRSREPYTVADGKYTTKRSRLREALIPEDEALPTGDIGLFDLIERAFL
jgi:hypothetical protein